mgnify:FL=1
MNIPFHKPNIPDNFDNIFSDSIKNGWITTGSQVVKFENQLIQYLDAEHVVVVNSCTAALHLALAAKEFKKGDKFIAPTLTFAATIECGEYLDMEPILLDSEEEGFLIDLNKIEDVVKKDDSIKAILPVHYAGEPVNVDYLMDLAEKYNLFILEDAAHALESTYNCKKIGNTEHAAAFSFYANKNLTTGGEGGAIATNNIDLAEKIKQLSLHGITNDGWNRFKTKGNWEYDIEALGYKYNLTDYAASFGLWQISQLDQWRIRRAEIFKYYNKHLKSIEGITLPKLSNGHSLHLFVIQLLTDKWTISRNKFIQELNKKGIGLGVHYKPIHQLSYYKKKYSFNYNNYPRANSLYETMISLPIYPMLTNLSLDYIIDNIIQLYDKYSK